jgi:hypothetical protein
MTFPTVQLLPRFPRPLEGPAPVPRLGEEVSLRLNLPCHQYRTRKIAPIPFDPRVSQDGKFNNLREAMTFIGQHCEFHHHTFNKNLVRIYLPFCRILSFVHGGYVPITAVPRKEFDLLFAELDRRFNRGR